MSQVKAGAESPDLNSDSTQNLEANSLQSAWQLERDAACLSRGIACERTWSDIVTEARLLVRDAASWPAPVRGVWSDNADDAPCGAALQSAARALDCAAGRTGIGGEAAREAGLWAATAFALGGNFPSASVVLKRTFPRLKSRPGSSPLGSSRAWPDGVAALVAALSPVLAPLVASHSPFAARVAKNGTQAHDDVLELLETETASVWPEFIEVARAAFAGAQALSTLAALDADGGALSGHKWSEVLAVRVPLLLPPQKVALGRGFLRDEASALAALPPGTGKTWLGELFLLERLARREQNGIEGQDAPLAVFLVPYVALGRGVVAALRGHTRGLDVEVRAWLGGESDEADLPNGAAIIVATPERFDGAWRAEPKLADRVCGVVLDEAHMVGEGARGARLETLVARFKMAGVRLLLLSAATDDTSPLGDWIEAPELLRLQGDWTPTARRLAFWRQDGRVEWWGELAGRGTHSLGETPLAWPRRDLRGGEGFMAARKQEGALWQNVAFGARQRFEEHGGSVLCLCATRRGARALARALASAFPEQIEPTGARAQALSLIETRYRTLLPLARLLKHGVAWHSAALPSDLRTLIERAVSEGEIVALASTRTLAEGVDLPFNQTILADWLAWDERGWRPLSTGLFRNIAGRCGRAGAFTEGDTWVFDNPLGPSQYAAPDVRAGVQRAQFLERGTSTSVSALETPDPVSPATLTAWESGLTALLSWHCARRGPLDADNLARAFGASRRDPSKWNEALGRVFDAWMTGDFARSDDAGHWTITQRGKALALCDVSGTSAQRLLDALASLPRRAPQTSEDAAKINAQLWHALGSVPESSEANAVWAARSKFVVRGADLVGAARDWLNGVGTATMFSLLPRVRESKGFPGEDSLRAWLDGEDASGQKMDDADADWTAPYDRFADWTCSALGTWTPRLWRACGVLSPLIPARPDLQKWGWNRFAARFAEGVPGDWAVGALHANAPGGRETVAIWNRHWPFASTSTDALGLSPLARDDQNARERADAAFESALREAGGPHCAQGLCVRALRDWLWARAGATK